MSEHEIPEAIRGYDWEQVFGAAGEQAKESFSIYNPGSPFLAVPPGHPDKDKPQPQFTRRDVAKIIAQAEGENDGADWICVGRLRDGRWFVVQGGCDYTGWD